MHRPGFPVAGWHKPSRRRSPSRITLPPNASRILGGPTVVAPESLHEPSGSLIGLILSSLAVMGSPGPSTMSVMALGAAFGLRRSVPYVSGIILGTVAVLLAASAGVVSMLLTFPGMAPALRAASAAYLIYLAVKIAMAPPPGQVRMEARSPSPAAGFLFAIANPKAYVAIAAVLAGSRLPSALGR